VPRWPPAVELLIGRSQGCRLGHARAAANALGQIGDARAVERSSSLSRIVIMNSFSRCRGRLRTWGRRCRGTAPWRFSRTVIVKVRARSCRNTGKIGMRAQQSRSSLVFKDKDMKVREAATERWRSRYSCVVPLLHHAKDPSNEIR